MIILGLVLLVLGFLLKVAILWTIGIIVLVVGLVLALMGATGRAVAGRRHYWYPTRFPARRSRGHQRRWRGGRRSRLTSRNRVRIVTFRPPVAGPTLLPPGRAPAGEELP